MLTNNILKKTIDDSNIDPENEEANEESKKEQNEENEPNEEFELMNIGIGIEEQKSSDDKDHGFRAEKIDFTNLLNEEIHEKEVKEHELEDKKEAVHEQNLGLIQETKIEEQEEPKETQKPEKEVQNNELSELMGIGIELDNESGNEESKKKGFRPDHPDFSQILNNEIHIEEEHEKEEEEIVHEMNLHLGKRSDSSLKSEKDHGDSVLKTKRTKS
jgi:hypothetical protein